MRGTSSVSTPRSASRWISIHVPLAGNVTNPLPGGVTAAQFLSTFPLRGTSPLTVHSTARNSVFLSTFPLRGTSTFERSEHYRFVISIHVPLAGNVPPVGRYSQRDCISIHVPLAGNVTLDGTLYRSQFRISIHVPLAGNVHTRRLRTRWQRHFYPRSPCGERPFCGRCGVHPYRYFYPRSPCGERRVEITAVEETERFLSTFPLRGTSHGRRNRREDGVISIHVPLAGNVTLTDSVGDGQLVISIHVPLAGNVHILCIRFELWSYFYPRSPCGERRQTVTDYCHLFAKVLVTVNIQF